ncbi:MAG: pyruvate dehydrogenase (acetyl-transferring) E1 component subunit alpha [Candidatus Neomarinimicrobiota bacterium]
MSGTRKKSLFSEYSPLKFKQFQIMDDEGRIVNPDWLPDLSDEQLLDAYKFMHYARTVDLQAVSYQRQGRMYTYPPNLGQEAIGTAAGFVMRPEDWLVPAFRELSAWLLKGATLNDIFLYWGGNEEGSLFSGAPNFLPSSVPIASQLIHAVGIGYAMNYLKKTGVAFAFVGDGGTSQGDFHEALNLGGVWKSPVVFIIQNNQYAISVPVAKQTAAKSLAIKATAYGIDGIQVDGNDYFAMYRTLTEAAEHARSGQGPVLVEAVTFRSGAHTTSDDPSLYRTAEEEEKWRLRDPLLRLGKHLIGRKLWEPGQDEELVNRYKQEIDQAFSEYEKSPEYKLEDVFKYHYRDLPDDLKRQQAEMERFLNWERAQS